MLDEATRRAAAPAAIVVVDDNPAIERFAAAVLTRASHTVLGAASGEEALTHAGSWAGPIDLLVTDVVLAGIDGCMVAQDLRRARPDIAVIFASGSSDADLRRRGIDPASPSVLRKPYTASMLCDAVEAAFRPNRQGFVPSPGTSGCMPALARVMEERESGQQE